MFVEVFNRREATSIKKNDTMNRHNDNNIFFLHKPASDFSLPKAHIMTEEETSTSNFSKMILLILVEIVVFPFFRSGMKHYGVIGFCDRFLVQCTKQAPHFLTSTTPMQE